MNIPLIFVSLSICVWIFPPFKQYKSDFFYFFLIQALSDPIKLVALYLLHIHPQIFSLAFALFLISSLMQNCKQIYFFIILSILSTVVFLCYSFDRNVLIFSLIGTHLIIVLILVNFLIKYIEKTKAFNLFLLLLISYEFISIIKYIAGVLSYEQGAISYYLAGAIQILFGILFSFISIKTKDFPILSKE